MTDSNLRNYRGLFCGLISLFVFMVLGCTSCSSPKDQYVSDLVSFTACVEQEAARYTSADWELALEQYYAFRKERGWYVNEMTDEELAIVDSCFRSLNALVGSGTVKSKLNVVERYLNEFQNLVEDVVPEEYIPEEYSNK